jgi:prolipoprotein diacylglyceryltransferase
MELLRPISPFDAPAYTLLLSFGVLITGAIVALRLTAERAIPAWRVGAVIDALLAGALSGIVAGRAFHVALNWAYFRYDTAEIWQVRMGGLDWHGVVVGALLGAAIMASLRRIPLDALLGALAFGLPVIALAGWWGCLGARCAYGAEVGNLSNYPDWLVWEARDLYNIIAPRYRAQAVGIGLSLALLLIYLAIDRLNWPPSPPDVRFWLMLTLLCAVMFMLGFLRGDAALAVGGLRADQWLDLALGVISMGMLAWRVRSA